MSGKLWDITLTGNRVIGAPEYCHANFTTYFTDTFWSNPVLSWVFGSRKPCYFNTGVMVIDLVKWRGGNYRRKIENWMELQRRRRIYELGSLPPFLLVFVGDMEAIDRRWNQYGLVGTTCGAVAGHSTRVRLASCIERLWQTMGQTRLEETVSGGLSSGNRMICTCPITTDEE